MTNPFFGLGRTVTVVLVGAACVLWASDQSSAVIVNSGSTNRPGFRIVVERSGSAEYTEARRRLLNQSGSANAGPIRRDLPHVLVERFFSDLTAAQPLSALPHKGCVKSVSFGTRLTIEFGKEETPDLSCPGDSDSRVQALRRDAGDILAAILFT